MGNGRYSGHDGQEGILCESGWLIEKDPGFANDKYARVGNGALSSLPGQPE